jgi:hypothetical protein
VRKTGIATIEIAADAEGMSWSARDSRFRWRIQALIDSTNTQIIATEAICKRKIHLGMTVPS